MVIDEQPKNGLEPSENTEFEGVMREYETPLLRYAARMLNDPSAAQDVVQTTFIKLYKGWENGAKPGKQMAGWLYRVTHNNAVDYIRKENRLRVLHNHHSEEEEILKKVAGNPGLEQQEKMTLALRFLRELEPDEQQVVVLRLQEGKTYREISEITKKSEGNVGYILHHAVKKLSKRLQTSGVLP